MEFFFLLRLCARNTILKAWSLSKNKAALKVAKGVSLINHYPVNALLPLLVLNCPIIPGFCPEVSMAAMALSATINTAGFVHFLTCDFSGISQCVWLLTIQYYLKWHTQLQIIRIPSLFKKTAVDAGDQ